ncbi:hypothetical protein HW555_005925 [Spodoptera exigua]|uniref:C2H2-type domain-containing protein n=1 Tax=Spodoptera exigua TaxID=7107 RepID=A0A835GJ57_SPOEX|nr:hypothetical protein HW555_005925 [Spodoptera exigua]
MSFYTSHPHVHTGPPTIIRSDSSHASIISMNQHHQAHQEDSKDSLILSFKGMEDEGVDMDMDGRQCPQGMGVDMGSVQTKMEVANGGQSTPRSKPQACKVCGKVLSSASSYYVHMKLHSGNKPFQCTVCDAAFCRKPYLEVHMRTHTGERPFQCDLCLKRFTQKSSLNTHKRVHTDEHMRALMVKDRPYKCDLCQMRFTQSSSLNRHKKIHTEEHRRALLAKDRPYQCGICFVRFTQKSSLGRHGKIHTGGSLPLPPAYLCVTYSLRQNGTNVYYVIEIAYLPLNVCEWFQLFNILEEHRRALLEKVRPYQCHICFMRFTQKSSLGRHGKIHTEEHIQSLINKVRPYQCDICDKRFTQKSSLGTHKRIHTGGSLDISFILVRRRSHNIGSGRVAARGRGTVMRRRRALLAFVCALGAVQGRPFACGQCPAAFARRPYLDIHMRTHTGERPYQCDACLKRFTQKWVTPRAGLAVRPPTPLSTRTPPLRICLRVVERSRAFVTIPSERFGAEYAASGDRSAPRPPPGQTVPVPVVPRRLHLQAIPGDTHAHAHRRAALSVRHLPEALHTEIQSQHPQADAFRYVGGRRASRCDADERNVCGLLACAAWGGGLSLQGRPFQCLQCPAAFTCKQYLEIHNRTHTGERPYQCDVCLKRFAQKSTLNIHKRTHTVQGRPYQCMECPAAFTCKPYLEIHMRTHTGERPFECDVCYKRFTQKSTLNIHKRIHTGERPYACDICQKRFAVKSYVTAHRWSHVADKPLNCDRCSMSFTSKSQFALHIRTHSTGSCYECSVCGRSFVRDSYLIRHHNRVHRENHSNVSANSIGTINSVATNTNNSNNSNFDSPGVCDLSFVPMVNRYMTSQGTQVSMQDTSKMSAMSPQSIASISSPPPSHTPTPQPQMSGQMHLAD